jgi:hypothetical protein
MADPPPSRERTWQAVRSLFSNRGPHNQGVGFVMPFRLSRAMALVALLGATLIPPTSTKRATAEKRCMVDDRQPPPGMPVRATTPSARSSRS